MENIRTAGFGCVENDPSKTRASKATSRRCTANRARRGAKVSFKQTRAVSKYIDCK